MASLLGSAAGLAAYLVLRRVLHRPDPVDGTLALPTDVLPPPAALAAVCLGLPLVATLAAVLLLRRVTFTPFGVVRRVGHTRGPRPWPGLQIGVGILPFVVLGSPRLMNALPSVELPADAGRWLWPLVLFLAVLCAAVGIVTGVGWISYTTGRILHRLARRPATLLAARRLTADPWQGSRTLSALLVCVLVGGGALGFRAMFATMEQARAEAQRRQDIADGNPVSLYTPELFYLNTMDLVDLAVAVAIVIAAGGLLVAVAEGIVARRRAYAALVATGVPRAVLGRSILWQSLLPAVPAVAIAGLTGLVMTRAMKQEVTEGGSWECTADQATCASDPEGPHWRETIEPVTMAVPVPLDHLAVLIGGALAAVLVVVGAGLLLLRSSTDLEELRTG